MALAPNVIINIPTLEKVDQSTGQYYLETGGKEKQPYKDCTVYYARRQILENQWDQFVCKTCFSKPGLHPEKWFEWYHTKPDNHLEWTYKILKNNTKYSFLHGSRHSRIDQVKLFKGCLPQILLDPFLNTLSRMFLYFFIVFLYFSSILYDTVYIWTITFLLIFL